MKQSSPGKRNDAAELARKPEPEPDGMFMMPAVERRPYRDLIGDIMGGTLSGAAFLLLCLGIGSDWSAYTSRTHMHDRLPKGEVGDILSEGEGSLWWKLLCGCCAHN